MDLSQLDLAFVIPALDESVSLVGLTENLQQTFGTDIIWMACIVDDGSTDTTWETIVRLRHADPRLMGVKLSRHFGKDAAILAGLSAIEADCYIVMDADGQHPPTVAKTMYERWINEHWDVINGIKRDRSTDTRTQRLSAWAFNRLFRRLSGIDIKNGSDFKLLSRQVVKSLLDCRDYNYFFRAMVNWVGYRQVDMLFNVETRIAGSRSWSFPQLVRYASNVLIQHSNMPLELILGLGLFSLFGSSLLLAKLLYQYLFSAVPSGYPTIVALLLISLSVNMIVVGLLGLYIKRIFDQSNGRPRYIVETNTEKRDLPPI